VKRRAFVSCSAAWPLCTTRLRAPKTRPLALARPFPFPKTRQSLVRFAPNRCRDQSHKCPVMQLHGITLSFHREMADSSRELVGSDTSAAGGLESYPRFIEGGFQDYEGLGIKRSTADSKNVPSPRSRLLGNNVFEPPPGNRIARKRDTKNGASGCRSNCCCTRFRRSSLGSNRHDPRTKIALLALPVTALRRSPVA
jgi:hypothetical protein